MTNDVARLLPDGSFAIIGRKDNIINSGGIKIPDRGGGRAATALPRPPMPSPPPPTLGWGGGGRALLASNLRGEMLTEVLASLPKYLRPRHIIKEARSPNRKRQDRPCRLPGASEKYHYKNTINMKEF